ncbi:UNVERIFIED_CONTAM: hypothetical protein Sradi_0766100, partial [Sesamum radiatum]
KNSLVLHPLGMTSKTLPTVACHLDFMTPLQPAATSLGIPTVIAIPCGVSSTGCFNNEWLEDDLHCNAHFLPPRCLSDHSSCIVPILDLPASKLKIWADHPDFITTLEHGWNLTVDGTAYFSLCRKLKAHKGPLKAFNNLHFGHISIRAKEVDLALQDAQFQLESDHENAAIRDSLGELRKKAIFLAEVEKHFYYHRPKSTS